MDAQSLPPQMPVPPAAGARRRVLWPLAAVAIVAIAGAGAGAYFGLRGAKGPGSGPGVTPPARAFAAAAYDEASHQVVMFGGEGADGASLGDTWTWDGTAWTQQHPASSPPPRAFAAMTYDPRKHDVVLVGGRTLPKLVQTICGGVISAGGPNATPGVAAPPIRCTPPAQSTELSDTWLWDGGTWRIAGTTPTLLPGLSPMLGTDPATGQVLMLSPGPPTVMTPAICPAPVPPATKSGAPVPQPAIACAIPQQPLRAWVWSGSGWTPIPAAPPPPGPGGGYGGTGVLASDPTSGHLVDVTWEPFATSCPAYTSAPIAAPCPLNTAGGVVAPAGNGSVAGSSGESSSAPTVLPPLSTLPSAQPGPMQPAPPPTRVPAPPAFPCCQGSMSTWTGSAWMDARPFSRGPGVIESALAGDPAQHELVSFTGLGTWTWNGSAWTQQHPAASPAAVTGGALVYDGVSNKLLLFGGEVTPTSRPPGAAAQPLAIPVSDELWAWDGSTWTQLTGPTSSPAPTPTPTPTPTFVPPVTPRASLPPSQRPSPSPSMTPCNLVPSGTPDPGKTTGNSAGPNLGCAVPSTSAVPPG